ncbi:hypothetical protein IW261DRAFT_1612998 [Armillaria novae-zelandiae]|uniref:Uncharacterized protein n=1 Tax=Armillaria novae-zelandiae TaxID=153914 RepID=A0AA39NKX2_9AGAR|nr:hypothetical protein IW261DRAFT_1612998 [Armillaria novae-zelandiae]
MDLSTRLSLELLQKVFNAIYLIAKSLSSPLIIPTVFGLSGKLPAPGEVRPCAMSF